jgi:FkbM family methyltransferase
MLIPVAELVELWGVTPKSVLHVGAHEAEELGDYEKFNWLPVTWVEAQPDKVEILKGKLPKTNHELHEAVVWDKSGEDLELKIMSNSQSTSLFNLGTHANEYPEIKQLSKLKVKTKTLSEILEADYTPDLIALDIQGAELRALQGLGSKILNSRWVYSEVNKKSLYEGCCLVSDLDKYLECFNFKRVVTRWTPNGWGDALYENKGLNQGIKKANIIVRKVRSMKWNFVQLIHRLKRLIKNLIFARK